MKVRPKLDPNGTYSAISCIGKEQEIGERREYEGKEREQGMLNINSFQCADRG